MTQFNITLQKDLLLSALDPVSRIARDKSALPILNHALLHADEQRGLTITGTNLETQVIANTLTDQTDAPGSIAVHAGKLFDLARLAPNDASIKLQLDGDVLHVRHGRSRYKLQTRAAEDFPAFDAGDLKQSILINAADLLSALQRVAFSMASGDVRHYLNGLAVHVQDESLLTVAANGHRLACQKTPLEGAAQVEKLQIIPRTAVEKITALLTATIKGAPHMVVEVMIGERTWSVTSGRIRLSTKLVEGAYPDVNRVIPKDPPTYMTAHCASLIAAVERVAVLGDHKERTIRLEANESGITLDAANQEQESGHETLDLLSIDGPVQTLGLNAGYLLDALRAVTAETVGLHLSDRAALIVDPDAPDWKALVMPVRL